MMPLAATWDLAFLCNFRCPYCFIKWHDGSIGVLHTAVTADDWARFWKKIYDDYGTFDITIAGGEPFVYPSVVELLENVSAWHILNVNTNLSWDPELIFGRMPPEVIKFSFSFHPHYEKFDRFLSRLQAMRAHGYKFITTVVAYPPMFDDLPQYRREFERHQIGYFFQPFQGRLAGKNFPQDYTPEQRRFLYGETVLEKGVMAQPMRDRSPQGRCCAAGQRRFRVTADGTVQRCFPSAELMEKPLGHIKDPDLKLLADPAPCPAQACYCPEEYSYLVDLNLKDTLSVEVVPQGKT